MSSIISKASSSIKPDIADKFAKVISDKLSQISHLLTYININPEVIFMNSFAKTLTDTSPCCNLTLSNQIMSLHNR